MEAVPNGGGFGIIFAEVVEFVQLERPVPETATGVLHLFEYPCHIQLGNNGDTLWRLCPEKLDLK
jgi:hypothetical protein